MVVMMADTRTVVTMMDVSVEVPWLQPIVLTVNFTDGRHRDDRRGDRHGDRRGYRRRERGHEEHHGGIEGLGHDHLHEERRPEWHKEHKEHRVHEFREKEHREHEHKGKDHREPEHEHKELEHLVGPKIVKKDSQVYRQEEKPKKAPGMFPLLKAS
jgi:hypothetical protein